MNTQRRPRWRVATAGSAAAALALGLGLAAPGAASDPTPDQLPTAAGATSTAVHELTLVTGDRLTVTEFADGRQGITVDPAPRDGEPSSFDTYEYEGQTYMVPSDAASLIPNVLDRELFNVTKLVEYGYTDGVPVIVEYNGSTARAPQQTTAGMTATATLESIDAQAATVDGPRWWRSINTGTEPLARGASTASLPGVEKVWLDGLVEAELDESVPLIGAPEAWDRGFDGTGMTVAVLDTGIDDTHPDLAGKVVAAENFSEEDSPADGHGHGTHVAGTVAGSGANSNGQYVGVAPGAVLMNGKVLNDAGTGTVAGVIEGMEWAAAQGADVVNMSLGTRESTDGTDPMAQAVNELTATHDTLFVISAGNEGPRGRTVGSPGSADSALTVGAVSKAERLASFSSRGPRLGDDTIKPDVTAPGVSITSADPGGGYRSRQGTSMAAPHVAGAAAILRQRSPDLGAPDVKALLASTGVPRDDLDVFEQGGGRIDVPNALDAPVLATPAPLNLGYFPFPHDGAEPVGAEVTYTNRTDEAVTLDLTLDVASQAGQPPPAAMLSVAPGSITVAPGATATATVSLDISQGETGLYGGYLIAEDDAGVAVRTPVGFHKEPETYTLTVEGIARDGQPARDRSNFHVVNVEDVGTFIETSLAFTDGAATIRVPTGTYAVMGLIYTYQGDTGLRQEQVFVGDPEVEVTEDTTVVLDARQANPIVVETPGRESKLKTNPYDHNSIVFWRAAERSGSFRFSTFTNYSWPAYAVPTDPVTLGDFEFMTRQRLSAPPDVTMSVVEPLDLQLDPIVMYRSTPLIGEIVAPLVDVGAGLPEDYEGVDAEGAVVLTRNGGTSTARQVINAADAGAAAVVVYNDLPGQVYNFAGSTRLPLLSLAMEEGEELLALLDEGDVTVRLFGNPSAPYLYDLVLTEEGHIREDLRYVADTDELAALDVSYHSDVVGQQRTSRFFWRPWGRPSGVGVELPFTPQRRTEYLVAEDMLYDQRVLLAGLRGTMEGEVTSYEPGERRQVSWGKKPFRPGVEGPDAVEPGTPTVRSGDTLETEIVEWVDASGHGNWSFRPFSNTTAAFRLYQDGELIAEADRAVGTFRLSPEPATYRLELDVARDADWWLMSTETHTAWTMQSARPPEGVEKVLPLLLVDYDVDLDLLNTAPHPSERTGPYTMDLTVRHQPGADGPPIAGTRAWISYDDGATWRARPTQRIGDGEYRVILDSRDPEESTGFVSLRVEAWDAAGNQIEQEITRAWRLPPR